MKKEGKKWWAENGGEERKWQEEERREENDGESLRNSTLTERDFVLLMQTGKSESQKIWEIWRVKSCSGEWWLKAGAFIIRASSYK